MNGPYTCSACGEKMDAPVDAPDAICDACMYYGCDEDIPEPTVALTDDGRLLVKWEGAV